MKEKIGEDDENDLLIKNEIKKKKPSNNRVMLKKLNYGMRSVTFILLLT